MRLVDAAADLFLGSCCPGCDRPGAGLCRTCTALIGATRPFRVPHLAPPVVAAGVADDLLRRLISAHKERSAWHLASVLADRLAVALAHLCAGIGVPADARVTIVPVPSTSAAVRRRGYDATTVLARRAARTLPIARPAVRRVLKHGRAVADQSGLSRAERARNMSGAMVARSGGAGEPAVIVDDLVTSGASLAEATRALRAGGWTVIGAAVTGAVGNFTHDIPVNHW